MAGYVGYRDGGKTNEEGLFKYLRTMLSAGVPTTQSATSLAVSQRGAGANMSVDVAIGDAHLIIPSAQYSYWGWFDAIANQTIATSDVTNPRVDVVGVYVDLSVVSSASNNNPGAFKTFVSTGTPAASPVANSDATIQTALGSTTPFVKLASIAVAANATTITTASITDTRVAITLAAGISGSPAGVFSSLVSSGDIQLRSTSLETIANERFFDHVASGMVWTADSVGTTLNASMTTGVVYISGRRVSVAAVTSRLFTASVDTYIDVDNTGAITYTTAANNGVSPALPAGKVRIGIIVTGVSSIATTASINQGQEDRVLPIASSIAYTVTDSLGNLICPRDSQRKIIGYRQIVTDFTTTSSADITGLNLTCIIPANRKIKITGFIGNLTSSVANSGGTMTLNDVTAAVNITQSAGSINSSGDSATMIPSFVTTAVGTRTYKAILTKGANAATVHSNGATSNPNYLMVELV